MDAEFILEAIRRKYKTTAIVPEISIDDYDLYDTDEVTEDGSYRPWANAPEGHKYMRRIDALMFRTPPPLKVEGQEPFA